MVRKDKKYFTKYFSNKKSEFALVTYNQFQGIYCHHWNIQELAYSQAQCVSRYALEINEACKFK